MTTEFAINDVVVTILVFCFGIGVGVSLRRMIAAAGGAMPQPEPSRPRCPYCGNTLLPVVVDPLHRPPPSEARWYCSRGDWAYQPCQKSVVYFADRPAAKPAPIEEL